MKKQLAVLLAGLLSLLLAIPPVYASGGNTGEDPNNQGSGETITQNTKNDGGGSGRNVSLVARTDTIGTATQSLGLRNDQVLSADNIWLNPAETTEYGTAYGEIWGGGSGQRNW